jgi:hypothetical protein
MSTGSAVNDSSGNGRLSTSPRSPASKAMIAGVGPDSGIALHSEETSFPTVGPRGLTPEAERAWENGIKNDQIRRIFSRFDRNKIPL